MAAVSHESAVLFVHGIGWQRPGETLRAFDRPLLALLSDLAERNAVESAASCGERLLVRIDEARQPPQRCGTATEPNHRTWLATVASGGPPARWLLAESCWSRSFPTPTGMRLALWILRVVPWLALFQLGAAFAPRMRRLEAAPDSMLGQMAGLARALPTAMTIYLGLLARGVLCVLLSAVIVVPALVTAFVPGLRWLSLRAIGLVGGSYAAVESPGSLDRMVDQINQDIDWCLRRSPQLVIVAHSQGGMLVREALARMPRGDRAVFIGLGSGLGPLHSLRRVGDDRLGPRGWLLLLLSTACVLLMAGSLVLLGSAFLAQEEFLFGRLSDAVRGLEECLKEVSRCDAQSFAPDHDSKAWVSVIAKEGPAWGVIAAMCVVGGLAVFVARRIGVTRLIEEWESDLQLPRDAVSRWVEYSSPFDPVSCGPLLAGCADEPIHEVINGPRLLCQHMAYRLNPAVLLRIATELGRATLSGIRIGTIKELEFRRSEGLRRTARDRKVIRAQLVVGWLTIAIAALELI